MKIAVSGATGFIGRHVAAELERCGVRATLLARDPERLGAVPHDIVTCDIHADDPEGAFERAGRPDVLLHLAWGGLPHYDALHHVERERPAQYRWLKAMAQGGLRRFVVAGTCFEYGLQSGPLHEGLDSRPVNAYGHAKDALRRELDLLRRQQPFGLTWARIFYLWGDGQASSSLWPALRAAAQRGDATFPMSGGEQLRDYLPVETAAAYLVALARSASDHGIVNVCSGQPASVRALVEGWIRAQGWTIMPARGHHPYPAYEPMAFWGDDSKLQRFLDATAT